MNQNPEQLARDRIDQQLTACGWMVQNKSSINLHAGTGVAVREYKTDVGPAEYIHFEDCHFNLIDKPHETTTRTFQRQKQTAEPLLGNPLNEVTDPKN